jgi:SWI/SNF-related matrix-associated actin-dependent regulator of chromatin subfamily A3
LSPIVDRYGGGGTNPEQLTLDGSIPWRGNHYMHPLQLDIRASEELFPQIKEMIRPLVPLRKEKKPQAAKQTTVVAVKKVDWKQQQAQLDALWKDMLQKQLEGLPDVPTPPALLSSLFPHQLDALRWLVHRERSNENPFYETTTENGKTVYLCNITQSSQQRAPGIIRGGLLADDMGRILMNTYTVFTCARPKSLIVSLFCFS